MLTGRMQVEHELLFPWRQTYCRYLHVAEAVAEDEVKDAWDGLGGRIKALRREVVANVADVKADVVDVKADVVKLGADMADLKGLLEKLVAQSSQTSVA